MTSVFEEYESQVRSYCRKYPTVFTKAKNAILTDENENEYIDFLAMAGSMNFGHNNPYIKKQIVDYLAEDNIINSLDMHTKAKAEFLESFENGILKKRGYEYKVMCCGPTGTNGVEAALKLARKNTGRQGIIAFSGAYHGMSLGSLAATTDRLSRRGAGVPLTGVTFVPYEGDFDSLNYLKWLLDDDHSGVEIPAAILLETVQAEGGINVASKEWLQSIRKICDEKGILMIVDDIQVGIGRTGTFFSFERAGIRPDMVVLSKSISGFGMPMCLMLVKPEYDIFSPAEHNGTFRGNQLSFIGCKAAVEYYCDNDMDNMVAKKADVIEEFLNSKIAIIDSRIKIRGIGMIWGIDFNGIDSKLAIEIVHRAFDEKLILEVAGRKDGVVKIIPPLTIEEDTLIKGLHVLEEIIKEVV